MGEPFRVLSDAEFDALTTVEKFDYLRMAVAHYSTVDESLSAKIAAIGDEIAKTLPLRVER